MNENIIKVSRCWEDGSSYEGHYSRDMRCGMGAQRWQDGDIYKGEFFKDHMHGFGLYRWSDGSYYEGTFYMDDREGVGRQYNSNNNSYYMGLLERNDFHGFGRMLYLGDGNNSYSEEDVCVGIGVDGVKGGREKQINKKIGEVKEDLGLWMDGKLVKMFNKAENLFVYGDFSELAGRTSVRKHSKHTKAYFSEHLLTSYENQRPSKKLEALLEDNLFVDQLPRSSISINYKIFDQAFQKHSSIGHDFFKEDVNASWYKEVNEQIRQLHPLTDNSTDKSKNVKDTDNKSDTKSGEDIDKNVGIKNNHNNKVNHNSTATNSKTTAKSTESKSDNIWNETPIMRRLQEYTLQHRETLISTVPHLRLFNFEEGVYEGQLGEAGGLQATCEDLLVSCGRGNESEVRALVSKREVHVDGADRFGNTGLFYAAAKGHNNTVKLLLKKGADIEWMNDQAMTVLYLLCALHFRRDIVCLADAEIDLRDHRKDVELIETDSEQKSLGDLFMKENCLNIVRKKSPIKYNISNDGLKSFNVAEERNSSNNFVKIKNGNDNNIAVNSVLSESKTENVNISGVLISNNNENKKLNEETLNNVKNKNYNYDCSLKKEINPTSKSNLLSKKNLKTTIKLLLEMGANVNFPPSSSFLPPTSFYPKAAPSSLPSSPLPSLQPLRPSSSPASSLKPQPSFLPQTSSLQLQPLTSSPSPPLSALSPSFLSSPPPPSFPPPTLLPCSPLLMAIQAGSEEIVNCMLKHGADPNHCPIDMCGRRLSALQTACSLKGAASFNISKSLLEKGAVIERLDQSGLSALELVCSHEDQEESTSVHLLQLLIDHKANLNGTFQNGHTALSYCIETARHDMIDVLLRNKADVNMALQNGLVNSLCVLVANKKKKWSRLQQIQLLRRMVEMGADVTCVMEIEGRAGNIIDYINLLEKQSKALNGKVVKSEAVIGLKEAIVSKLGSAMRVQTIERASAAGLNSSEMENATTSVSNENNNATQKSNSTSNTNIDKSLSGRTKWNSSIEGKSMMRFCQHCGRSAGLKLFPCPKCRSVYFCGKLCMHLSWNKQHRYDCPRLSAARIISSSKNRRGAQDNCIGEEKLKLNTESKSRKNNYSNKRGGKDFDGWSFNKGSTNLDLTKLYHAYYDTDSKGISRIVKEWERRKQHQFGNAGRPVENTAAYSLDKMDHKAILPGLKKASVLMGNYSYI